MPEDSKHEGPFSCERVDCSGLCLMQSDNVEMEKNQAFYKLLNLR